MRDLKCILSHLYHIYSHEGTHSRIRRHQCLRSNPCSCPHNAYKFSSSDEVVLPASYLNQLPALPQAHRAGVTDLYCLRRRSIGTYHGSTSESKSQIQVQSPPQSYPSKTGNDRGSSNLHSPLGKVDKCLPHSNRFLLHKRDLRRVLESLLTHLHDT